MYSRIEPADNHRGYDAGSAPPLPNTFRQLARPDEDEDDDARHPFTEPGIEIEQDSGSRLSVMGPKMKLLSRAPWDEGPAGIAEEDEPLDDNSDNISVYSRKRSRDRGRTITKGVDEAKTWMGFSRARSRDPTNKDMISNPIPIRLSDDEPSSPSPHLYHTPRTQPARPRFTSTTNSTRADSLASSSSASAVHPPVPSPRSDQRSVSTPASPASPTFPRSSNPNPNSGSPTSSAYLDSRDSYEDAPHPYANPEIYKSASSKLQYPPSPSNAYMFSKVTASTSETISAYPRSDSATTIKKGTAPLTISTSSSIPFPPTPHLQSPSSPRQPTPISDLSGMQAFPGSPAYKLISLEEARGIRSRTKSNAIPTSSKGPKPLDDHRAQTSFHASTSSFRKAVSQTSLATQLSSTSLVTASSSAQFSSLAKKDDGESPPLPPLPAASPTGPGPMNSAGTSTPGATITPIRTVKPKRSGFLKMFDRDKDRNKGMGDQFVAVPLPGRSVSNVPDSGIGSSPASSEGGRDATFVLSADALPPLPPIPLQYRQESKGNVESDIVAARSKSLPEAASRGGRALPPPALVHPQSSFTPPVPSVGSKTKTSKSSKKSRVPTLDLPADEPTRDTEFHSLEVRPISSLFSSMDLMLHQPEDGGAEVSVRDNEGVDAPNVPVARPGGGTGVGRRRPMGLNIGIPPNPLLDPSSASSHDFYSPLSSSSLSSTFSRSGSGATDSTPGGPFTPRSLGTGGLLSPLSQSYPTTASTSVSSSTPSQSSKSSSSSTPTIPTLKTLQSFEERLHLEQDKMIQARKAWQLQKWEYEAQIRDLESELEEARAKPCAECGVVPHVRQRKGSVGIGAGRSSGGSSIMDRERPRTKSATHSAYSVGI